MSDNQANGFTPDSPLVLQVFIGEEELVLGMLSVFYL